MEMEFDVPGKEAKSNLYPCKEKLRVAGEVYPSFNSTDTISVDIFLSGCAREPHCEGCHNQELWDFKAGKEMEVDLLAKKIGLLYKNADAVAVMGGEPLHQKEKLALLLDGLRKEAPRKSLWLYTSYELDQIDRQLLEKVDYVKTGRFDSSKKCKGWLSSSNQRIWKSEAGGKEFSLYHDPSISKRK